MQVLVSLATTSLLLFKTALATLLSLFVPQKCGADPENGFPEEHSCTISENMGLESPLTTFEKFVLVFNFVTLGLTLVHLVIIYFRERMMIDYLDADPKQADDALPQGAATPSQSRRGRERAARDAGVGRPQCGRERVARDAGVG
jgi:hypothetical protein